MSVGVGMYLTADFVVPRVLGALGVLAWRKCDAPSHGRYMLVVASGFVLGEGVWSDQLEVSSEFESIFPSTPADVGLNATEEETMTTFTCALNDGKNTSGFTVKLEGTYTDNKGV